MFARYGASSFDDLEKVRPPTPAESREPGWRPLPDPGVDDRERFLRDFGRALYAMTRTAQDAAGPNRLARRRIGRFEGLRDAYALFVRQVDAFGVPRREAGIGESFDADRDLSRDGPPGAGFIVASDDLPEPDGGLPHPTDDQR